jgi:hypothetical protein
VDTSRKYLLGLWRHVLYGRYEPKIYSSIVCNIHKYERIKRVRKQLVLMCDSHLLFIADVKICLVYFRNECDYIFVAKSGISNRI